VEVLVEKSAILQMTEEQIDAIELDVVAEIGDVFNAPPPSEQYHALKANVDKYRAEIADNALTKHLDTFDREGECCVCGFFAPYRAHNIYRGVIY
jgi:hypothetical protein